jgi:hypothetical protein
MTHAAIAETPHLRHGADGRCAYFGPNGAPAIAFFTSTSSLAKKPFSAHDNEAEWIVDNITTAAKDGRSRECAEAYLNSALCARNMAELELKLGTASLDTLPAAMQEDLSGSGTLASAGAARSFFRALGPIFKYKCAAPAAAACCQRFIMLPALQAGRCDGGWALTCSSGWMHMSYDRLLRLQYAGTK